MNVLRRLQYPRQTSSNAVAHHKGILVNLGGSDTEKAIKSAYGNRGETMCSSYNMSPQFVRPSDLQASASPYEHEPGEHDDGGSDSDNWDELHDILFKSVGLERLRYSLRYVQNEMGDAGNFGASLEGPPLRSLELSPAVQGTLVEVYFRHDHFRCPAVDEVEFMTWYRRRQKLAESPLQDLLLSAVLFSAFSHANEDLLRVTPYDSLTIGHRRLFNQVQSRYHDLSTANQGSIALVQTALLLSHWSPYDSSKQVNSFWVDEAFRHAIVGGLAESQSTQRARIVWWCCLTRNRLIALGLRRPRTLKSHVSGRLPTVADFGPEAVRPWFQTPKSKKAAIKAFVALCELSGIIEEAVRFKAKVSEASWWITGVAKTSRHIEEIGVIDEQLTVWRSKFDTACSKLDLADLGPGELVFLHIVNMVHMTTVSALYEQCVTFNASSDSRMWMVRSLAIHKVKEASTDIALICGSLLKHARPEELPLMLGAWIILPVAVHLVLVNTQRGFEDESKLKQLEYLMRVLYSLSQRFEGAQFVTKVIDAVTKAFQSAKVGSTAESSTGPSLFPAQRKRLQAREDELLLSVLEIIQQGLADGVVPKPQI